MPRLSYTEAPVFTPQRIARSRPMLVDTAPSIFSVDFSCVVAFEMLALTEKMDFVRIKDKEPRRIILMYNSAGALFMSGNILTETEETEGAVKRKDGT